MVIPFGIQGAIIGHWIMGVEISVISLVGFVALTGIIVNDSLVLMDYVNQKVREGTPWREAVAFAGQRRFRAVILMKEFYEEGLITEEEYNKFVRTFYQKGWIE